MAFILVLVGGYYLLKGNVATPAPVDTTTQEVTPTVSHYATTTFAVDYPPDFTIDPNFSNTSVNPNKPIAGVKFTIPMTMATGTNLSADSFVSVETLPRAKSCTGDIYLAANVLSHTVTDSGREYSVATSTGAAAGNRYEEIVFALSNSQPCTAVRYFIHSGAIGNYPEGTVREFDRSALIAAFDKIRTSLILGGGAAGTVETGTGAGSATQ